MVPYTRVGWDRRPRVRANQTDGEGWAEISRQEWSNGVAGEMGSKGCVDHNVYTTK